MATRKTLSSRVTPEALNFAASMLRVMAHPLRLLIIDRLRNGKKMSVASIQQQFNLPQPIISQHLILLQKYKILNSEKVGKQNLYYLANFDVLHIVKCVEKHCTTLDTLIVEEATQTVFEN